MELDLISFYRVEIQLNIELWAGYLQRPLLSGMFNPW